MLRNPGCIEPARKPVTMCSEKVELDCLGLNGANTSQAFDERDEGVPRHNCACVGNLDLRTPRRSILLRILEVVRFQSAWMTASLLSRCATSGPLPCSSKSHRETSPYYRDRRQTRPGEPPMLRRTFSTMMHIGIVMDGDMEWNVRGRQNFQRQNRPLMGNRPNHRGFVTSISEFIIAHSPISSTHSPRPHFNYD